MAKRKTDPQGRLLERPLDGVRVLEMGQLIAGPLAGTLLAWFGAEVIKIEPPGEGDPLRGWRVLDRGTSLWWRSVGRNKRCVTLDLRKPAGRDLARRLAARADVVLENFRPGTMEAWGLGPRDLEPLNPRLVYARVSGYGQTGPDSRRGGYAAVCEAVGGLRYITGEPGAASVRANVSLGDHLAALETALGIMVALYRRDARAAGGSETVDVAIVESVARALEGALAEHDFDGTVREPSGSTVTGIAPTGAYPCADGRSVVIGANSTSNYTRLMDLIGRTGLARDASLQTNAGRVARRAELDAAITEWTQARASGEVLEALAQAAVPAGPINTVADLLRDPHFRERGLLESCEVEGTSRALPVLGPRLQAAPGRTEWPGPALGAHNREVFGDLLGLSDDEYAALEADGVV